MIPTAMRLIAWRYGLLFVLTLTVSTASAETADDEICLVSFGQTGSMRTNPQGASSDSECQCPCCLKKRCKLREPDWDKLPLGRIFDPDRRRFLPIFGNAVRDAGFDIPLPHGMGGNIAYIDQPMEIFDIRLGVGGAPPSSLSIPPFRVQSQDTNISARYDAWILPFVNIYGIFGRTSGVASGNITVSGVPGLLPDTVIPIQFSYAGPTNGGGVTFAGGGERFFFALDINYAETDLQADDVIRARTIGPRVGLRGRTLSAWVGGFYMNVDKEISGSVDVGGTPVQIEVNLDVVTDWNFIYGARWEPCKNLELIIEHGFSVRNQVIGAFAVRF